MLVIYLLSIIPMVYGLIAYDCNGERLNVTSVSLVKVGDCNIDVQGAEAEESYVQLLQLAEYEHASYYQCKIEIKRTIYYCGMSSHISAVHNGYMEYLADISREACIILHREGTISLGNGAILTGISANSTSTRTFTLAGTLANDGTCSGTQYADPYGSWNGVVVQALAKITLRSGSAAVKLNQNKLILRSGTSCSFQDGFCIDGEDGHTFWKPTPETTCKFEQYDVLYEGIAQRITERGNNSNLPVIYTLTTNDITFALTKVSEQHLCGYTLLRTEHPKLFILETRKGRTFAEKKTVAADNLDIFTYMNSKFVYVERHLRGQMTALYTNILSQKCALERQVMENALSIASILPEEFAWSLMKGPGFMATTAGEAIHIIKCIPVEVKIRRTEECFVELPVLHGNTSRFMKPKTRILVKQGTHRDCNPILPVMYNIDDSWHKMMPNPVETIPPQELKPMTRPTWKYTAPASLAVSGIYSQADIDKLRDHIMFPAEKDAILNSLARGVTGQTIIPGTIAITHLMDEAAVQKLAEGALSKIWNHFITFGSISAGLIAVFILIKFVKTILDTIIHGYSLYAVFGCGIELLGAVWTSLTYCLLQRAHRRSAAAEKPELPAPCTEGERPNFETPRPNTRQPRAPLTPRLTELSERMDRLESNN